MIEDDKQFWNFCYDIVPDQFGELPCWKGPALRMHQLFKWLPWGGSRTFQVVVQVAAIELTEFTSNKAQTLGEPSITVLDSQELSLFPDLGMGGAMIMPAAWQHIFILDNEVKCLDDPI